ncbi:MAG: hypothetical protein ABUL44_04480 [Flavobacterium sp.]
MKTIITFLSLLTLIMIIPGNALARKIPDAINYLRISDTISFSSNIKRKVYTDTAISISHLPESISRYLFVTEYKGGKVKSNGLPWSSVNDSPKNTTHIPRFIFILLAGILPGIFCGNKKRGWDRVLEDEERMK